MRQTIQSVEERSPAASKHDVDGMLTAFEDILLTIGDAHSETDHRVKMIAQRAIAKAQGR